MTSVILGDQAVIGGTYIQPYLGFVATRGKSPDTVTGGGNVQCMSRSKHVAMDYIPALKLALAAWYANNGVETGAGGTGTFTASIEYPAGTTPTRITFAGAASGTAATGTTLISDFTILTTPIPRGAAFYVRIYQTFSAGGFVYASTPGLNNGPTPYQSGEWANFGASGITDLTGVTTNVNGNFSGNSLGSVVPLAILGYTTRSSILITGDSRNVSTLGYSEYQANAEGATGETARSVIKNFAYCNVSCGGEKASQASASSLVQRALMAAYCSHVVCGYGINDFNNSESAATVLADIVTFAGLLGNKPMILSTVSPQTNSTDGWGTTTNQTVYGSAANTQRISYNDSLRRGYLPYPIVGIADVALYTESGVNTGLWPAAQRSATDFAMTSGSGVLTSAAGAKFTPEDVFKTVSIIGAGTSSGVLVGYITAYTSATSVTLTNNAGTTVSAATGYVGTATQEGLHGSASIMQNVENSNVWSDLLSFK